MSLYSANSSVTGIEYKFLKNTTMSIGTAIIKMNGAANINLMMVKKRVTFSENSSIVSSESVSVYIRTMTCLKYAIGRYAMFCIVKNAVNVRPKGR